MFPSSVIRLLIMTVADPQGERDIGLVHFHAISTVILCENLYGGSHTGLLSQFEVEKRWGEDVIIG